MESPKDKYLRLINEIMNKDGDLYSGGHYLEVTYIKEFNMITIYANKLALRYLQTLLQDLIDSNVPEKHYHLDRDYGLVGNIEDIAIGLSERVDNQ